MVRAATATSMESVQQSIKLKILLGQVQCNSETDAGERVDALVKYLLACRHHIRETDISEEVRVMLVQFDLMRLIAG